MMTLFWYWMNYQIYFKLFLITLPVNVNVRRLNEVNQSGNLKKNIVLGYIMLLTRSYTDFSSVCELMLNKFDVQQSMNDRDMHVITIRDFNQHHINFGSLYLDYSNHICYLFIFQTHHHQQITSLTVESHWKMLIHDFGQRLMKGLTFFMFLFYSIVYLSCFYRVSIIYLSFVFLNFFSKHTMIYL